MAKGKKRPAELPEYGTEQTAILLDSMRELPPYVFVMIGLYARLRREEILGLQWDCDLPGCYGRKRRSDWNISVRRAWQM